jgi:hypothetical protein
MKPLAFRKLNSLPPVLSICIASVSLAGAAQIPTNAIPDFGPNVLVFDAAMPMATIQSNLNSVFNRQERSQFGSDRYAYFFKPGAYSLDVNVGFYTQVLGLGQKPGQTTINGSVHSEADWMKGNATCTFWRALENLSVVPASATPINWAVSQGTSFRRMHVAGNVNLWDGGWSSGGFMADCKIDGQVNSGSQQQWFSRNDDWGGWTGASWNMTFVGVVNPPPGDWPKPPYTVIEKTPLLREKPFLFLDKDGRYAVMTPALETSGVVGTSWDNRSTAGTPVPISRFYLARPDKDNAVSINAALAEGRHLMFTPGIYHLDGPILVTRAGTMVMGLGYTTLIPDKGTPAMVVSDVDGITLAGIMFDAGAVKSPVLLQVGAPENAGDHSKNPTFLYDVFFRVGGAAVGAADTCLAIHSGDVVGDNLWIWRADHGAGASWDRNPSKNGLIVNGKNVTIYGLFVEHFQEYQTLWNGDGGRVYFYQCELPYDAPSQNVWQHDGVDGFAAYKVADTVKNHEAWGVGVYGVFTRSPTKCFNAMETPNGPGIKMRHLVSIWITGKPGTEISHVINGKGAAVNSSNKKTTMD